MSANTASTRSAGACSQSTARCCSGREPGGLPRLRGEVEHDDPARRGLDQRGAQIGHQQVRQHAGEPRPGPEGHHVGRADRGDRLGAGARRSAAAATRAAPGPGVDGDRRPGRGSAVRRAGSAPSPVTSAPMSSGSVHIGSTRPRTPSSRRRRRARRPGRRSTSISPRGARLPTAWPASAPLPPKRCWNERAPQAAGLVVGRPGRPTPSAGRRAAAGPARGAAVPTSRRRRPR